MPVNKMKQPSSIVFAGGDRSVITAAGDALLEFFDTKKATLLRAVSRELRAKVADHPWDDQESIIRGAHVVGWHACFPHLHVVNLSKQVVPVEAFEHLRKFSKLNLSFAQFPEFSLDGEYPRLMWLDLTEEHASGTDNQRRLTDIAVKNLRCPLLTFLSLDSCEGITWLGALQHPLLTNLDLAWCSGITDVGLKALRCPLLSTLYLSSTSITDAGLEDLQCPLLTTLNLSGCKDITDAGLAALQCPLITTLDLSWCTEITSLGVLQCPLLTNVDLRSCSEITDAGLAALRCPLLNTLDLSWCTGITWLGALECPLLTKLDLRSCSEIADAGLAALRCPLLTTLNLKDCYQITNTGLGALQCPSLATLNLESTSIEVPDDIQCAQEMVRYAHNHP